MGAEQRLNEVVSPDALQELFATWVGIPTTPEVSVGRFSAQIRHSEVARVGFGRIQVTNHTVRSKGSPHRDRLLVFNVQLRGTGRLIQGGESFTLRPGDIAIYDSTLPFVMTFDGHVERVGVTVPFDLLPASGAHGPMGQARRMVHSLALSKSLDGLEAASADAPYTSVGRLAGLLSATAQLVWEESAPIVDPAPGEALRVALRFIDEHLADPALTPERVAHELLISLRSLYTLFSSHGLSVAATIRSRRLEYARHQLATTPFGRESIADVAVSSGFVSASHFSTAFKEAFGLTPREYRRSPARSFRELTRADAGIDVHRRG